MEFACALGPAGYLPKAPGTWGSLLATALAPLLFLPLGPAARVTVLVSVFVIGGLMATRVERNLGRKDPGQVVIDELLGQWMALMPLGAPSAAMDWALVCLGFGLFRFFDILKPWPVRSSETWLPGGFGIMIDDLLAGCWAAAILWVLVFLRI
ncbi:MAG: phosphatidylglycerophosphatase A [Deltaproteobacteria bacterium]|nr:phosphatidylglycerophosphatase A [Deltaproteobacteria bacterium]